MIGFGIWNAELKIPVTYGGGEVEKVGRWENEKTGRSEDSRKTEDEGRWMRDELEDKKLRKWEDGKLFGGRFLPTKNIQHATRNTHSTNYNNQHTKNTTQRT